MNKQAKVKLFFPYKTALRERGRLKAFIEQIFRKEGKKLSGLSYVFCSDKYLLRINQDFLQHNYYTDIITFGLSEKGQPAQAEIYISVERVRENAKQLDVSFRLELHRVIFHGVLHLCGYGDKSKDQVKKMRKKEDLYLNQYFRPGFTGNVPG